MALFDYSDEAVENRKKHPVKSRLAMIAFLVIAVIVGGAYVAWDSWRDRQESLPAGLTFSSTPTHKARKQAEEASQWNGLRQAGLPLPGAWSSQRFVLGSRGEDYIKKADRSGVPSSWYITLPHDTFSSGYVALKTVNDLIDSKTSDAVWAARMRENFHAVPGHEDSYYMPNAPRYWWAQRKFAPNTLCTDHDAALEGVVTGLPYPDSDLCSADGLNRNTTETENDTSLISVQPRYFYYGAKQKFNFPTPQGLSLPSTVDPQLILQSYFNVVTIPMDDGLWHVTTYCPAAMQANNVYAKDGYPEMFTDKNGKPYDKVLTKRLWESGGLEKSYLPEGSLGLQGPSVMSFHGSNYTGYGLPSAPCVVTEVAVGGQTPFWLMDTSDD